MKLLLYVILLVIFTILTINQVDARCLPDEQCTAPTSDWYENTNYGFETHSIYFPSLKQQIQSGWENDEFVCHQNKKLAFKIKDNSPLCLFVDTKEKLLERNFVIENQHPRLNTMDVGGFLLIGPTDGHYNLSYAIKGSTIESFLHPAIPYGSLNVSINPSLGGKIILSIPRNLFISWNDDPLLIDVFVLNEGKIINHRLIEDDSFFTLSFDYNENDTLFEIVGMKPVTTPHDLYVEFFREQISDTCPITYKTPNAYSYDPIKCRWISN